MPNQRILHYAKTLRKNQTLAEKKLWSKIRNRQLVNIKFRRQYAMGSYILDFFCPEKNLAIELDGSQHLTSKGLHRDKKRKEYLINKNIVLLRFSSRDVLIKTDSVLKKLISVLNGL